MEKSSVTSYDPSYFSKSRDEDTFLDDDMFFESSTKRPENDIHLLFNPHKLEDDLEQRGYQIPKLMIKRTAFHTGDYQKEYNLPISNHDIYEERTFPEFQKIVKRLYSSKNNESNVIHFKIDYNAIWEAITKWYFFFIIQSNPITKKKKRGDISHSAHQVNQKLS